MILIVVLIISFPSSFHPLGLTSQSMDHPVMIAIRTVIDVQAYLFDLDAMPGTPHIIPLILAQARQNSRGPSFEARRTTRSPTSNR